MEHGTSIIDALIVFSQGRHALVYDINTPNETWEWVDLNEVNFTLSLRVLKLIGTKFLLQMLPKFLWLFLGIWKLLSAK